MKLVKKVIQTILTLSLLLSSVGLIPAAPNLMDVGNLNSRFSEGAACYNSTNTKQHTVNVSVATLWQEPNKARVADNPAISNPADIEKWTSSMALKEKQWLVGKIETQALYGEKVIILDSSGDWYQVAVTGQSSPKNNNGYPGWVPKSQITESLPDYEDCSIAIVDAPSATLYNEENIEDKFMELSYNTRLSIVQEDEDWLQVQTPVNGVKYLRKQGIEIVDNEGAIPKPLEEDIVDSAKKFTGLPYLWAGISGFGFDCSGLTFAVYNRHGIVIPRDSGVQAVNGTPVAKKDLQPADLLFFSHEQGKGQVHHVGMYIGNGQMIHAPNPKRGVEVISVDIEPYKSEFSGARRYLE